MWLTQQASIGTPPPPSCAGLSHLSSSRAPAPSQFGGRQQVFIGVTTPLVWAATRPPPPKEELRDDEDDDSGSCSESTGSNVPGSAANSRPQSAQAPSLAASNRGSGPRVSPSLLGTGGLLAGSAAAQPQPPDAYAIAAALGALTDRDAPRRAPGLTARDTHEVGHKHTLVAHCGPH